MHISTNSVFNKYIHGGGGGGLLLCFLGMKKKVCLERKKQKPIALPWVSKDLAIDVSNPIIL